MDDSPGVIISRITKSGFVTSSGRPARIVSFKRNADLFEDFHREFKQSWLEACWHEDLLLFHTEIPADHLNQPFLWLSVLLGAWGSLNAEVFGLQMKKDSQEVWLLRRIPDKRISLRHLFKAFPQGAEDCGSVIVNVDLQTVLAEMVSWMAHFHREGVSNLSITEDCVNFSPHRQDFRIDFSNLTDVFFKGQPTFISGWKADWENAYFMKKHNLEKMEMNRCLILQTNIFKETSLGIPHTLDSSIDCDNSQDQPSLKYPTQESRHLYNGRQPSDIVLERGNIKIREVDYRSLDSTLPENEFEVIKKAFPKFREGCLSDGVMIGFFMSLRKEAGPSVIVLTTSELQKPETEINVDIQGSLRWILAPWNPGYHWILIAVDMKDRIVYYLDPDPRVSETTIRFRDWEVLGKVMSLLKWRPNSIIMNIPGCSKQAYEDDNNCGVFVCFYAEQLVSGKSISLGESVDTQKMRSDIRGKLLKHADYVHPSRKLLKHADYVHHPENC